MGVFRLAVMGLAFAGVVSCASPTGPDDGDPIEIRGQIWGQVLQGMQNPNGNLAPDTYVNPVAGAVIATSLNSVTAVSRSDRLHSLYVETSGGPEIVV